MGLFDRFKKQQENNEVPTFYPSKELRIVVMSNTNGMLKEQDIAEYLEDAGNIDAFVLLGGVGMMDMLKVSWCPQWSEDITIGVPMDGRDEAAFFRDGTARSVLKETAVIENVRFGGYSKFFNYNVNECDVLLATEWGDKVDEFISAYHPKAVIIGNMNGDGVIGETKLLCGYGLNRFVVTNEGVRRF